MTELERKAKKQITRILGAQGYKTYAMLFDLFDLTLVDRDDVVAYMIPGKAKIVVNCNLDEEQVSTIVRHEILHEYLTHGERADKWFKDNPNKNRNQQIVNIAADYEISNKGYTDKDKRISRSIKLGDKVLQGLVTEIDHPDWEHLSFEEMLEKLVDEQDKLKQQMQNTFQDMNLDPDLVDEIERQAQQQQKQSEESAEQHQKNSDEQASQGDSEGAEEEQQKAEQSEQNAQQAQGLGDEVSGIGQEQATGGDIDNASNDKVFPTKEKADAQADLVERVKKIKEMLKNLDTKQKILDETDAPIKKEKAAKKAKMEREFLTSPKMQFQLDLQTFIQKQISTGRGASYSRFNNRYDGTGIIMPGKTSYSKRIIPKINVYWDKSGSFIDPEKTEGAKDAIKTLGRYVTTKKISVDMFYVCEKVSTTEPHAGAGANGKAIIKHIQQTKPDNVIIITDSDPDAYGYNDSVTVPGAVWFLFYENEAPDFLNHLSGQMQTKSYLFK